MKIEIDLSALGVEYDEDGTAIHNSSLEDAIVNAAAEKLLRTGDITRLARVSERVNEIATERVSAMVADILAQPIRPTSPWGESSGAATTVREIVRKAVEDFLTAPARGDRYGNHTPQNLRELVQETTKYVLSNELKAEIAQAKKDVHNLVREKAIKAAADAIAKG